MLARLVAAGLVAAASGCAAAPTAGPPAAPTPPVRGDHAVDEVPAAFRRLMPPAVAVAGRHDVASSVPEPEALAATSALVRCPAGMALVDDRFCIDRWEATIVARMGAAEAPHSPYEPLDTVDAPYRAVTAPGVAPQGYVSGLQAAAACRASGKRLCTASEWERACRGPGGARFPYGDRRQDGTCNDDVRASHPVVEAARRLGVPADETWTTGMNLSLVNQLPGGLAPTGEREGCATSEGVFDMVGNLHEWIADPDGTFRGGFYMDTSQNGEGCAYQTTAHDVGYHDYSTGFRCCAHADDVE